MKRIILICSLLISGLIGFSQSVIQRSNGLNTLNDPRWEATGNLFIPKYLDTTAANLNLGIDSSGAIFYSYLDQSLMIRKHNPKRWEQVGSGAGNPNTNIGAGYRLTVPFTNDVKTLFTGIDILFDSTTNTNGITVHADTTTGATKLATQGYVTRNTVSNSLTSAHILVGNGSNVATDVNPTLNANMGNFALSNTGVFTYPFLRNGLDVIPSGISKFGSSNNRSFGFWTNGVRAMFFDSSNAIVNIDSGILFSPKTLDIHLPPYNLPSISFGGRTIHVDPRTWSTVYQTMGIKFRDNGSMSSIHGFGYEDGDGMEEMFAYTPEHGEFHVFSGIDSSQTVIDMYAISHDFDIQSFRNINIKYDATFNPDTPHLYIGSVMMGKHQLDNPFPPDLGYTQLALRLDWLSNGTGVSRINGGADSLGYRGGIKYPLWIGDEGSPISIGRNYGYTQDSTTLALFGNMAIWPTVPTSYRTMQIGHSGNDLWGDIGSNNVHTNTAGVWKNNPFAAGVSSLLWFYNGGFVFKGTNVVGTPSSIHNYNDFLTIDNTGSILMPFLGTASSDTTTYKPMGMNSSGKLIKMNYWPGGGGGISTAVDSIYRTVGKDSIQFTINGRYHAIKDSTGSGSPSLTATYIGYGDGSNLLTGTNTLTYNNSTTTLKLGATTSASLGILRINSTDGEGKISFVYGVGNAEYGYMKINTAAGSFGFGSASYPLDFFSGGAYRFWDNNLQLYRSAAAGTGDIRLNLGYNGTTYGYFSANTGTGVTSLGSASYPVQLYSEGNNVITFAGANTKIIGKTFAGGTTTPTALIHLAAGTATANTAPLKFTTTSAALLTTPEAGAMEVLVDSLYYTGNSGTRYKIYPHGLITPYNGLTKVGTDSLKLGGTLVENTVIATASNTLSLSTSTASVNPLSVSASSGIGIYAQSTSGLAISAFTNGSVSGQFALRDNSTNTVLPVMNVQRRTFNTPAPGIGASIDFYLDATPTTTPLSNSIISKLTDTTTSARTSQFIITGVNSGSTTNVLTLDGNGQATFMGDVHLNNSGSLYLQSTNSFSGDVVSNAQPIINSGSSNRIDAINLGAYTYVSTSSAATLSLAANSCYMFTGTTTTWTLPAVTSNTGIKLILKNKGSGNITLNSNAGGNDIYDTSAVSSLTITPGQSVTLVNDGTNYTVVMKY